MYAVHNTFWNGGPAGHCDQYQEGASKVCELVSKDVEAKKTDIMKKGAESYKNYGGQYGFSLEYCKQECKCCSAPELFLEVGELMSTAGQAAKARREAGRAEGRRSMIRRGHKAAQPLGVAAEAGGSKEAEATALEEYAQKHLKMKSSSTAASSSSP
eukprot:g2183.t1